MSLENVLYIRAQIAAYSLSASQIQYDLFFLGWFFEESPNHNLDRVHPQPVPAIDQW